MTREVPLFRIVRQTFERGREVVCEGFEMTSDEVSTTNRALCAAGSSLRVWPVTTLAPLRHPVEKEE
jgi:hypothetical protein